MGQPRGDRVNGVLLLDKPVGVTSNRALQTARRLLNSRKAGHTGTLDPMASGLLPVMLGEATKFSADLLDADKSYRATVRLGVTTTTGDAEGEVVERRAVDIEAGEIEQVLARFTGDIEQVPPMHSALKRGGRPLYELARAGIEVERAPRAVRIHGLRLIERASDTMVLDVECSKGTYVRVLAEDIGKALGCGAHLAALRRTRVGPLTIDDAVELAALEGMEPGARRKCLRPVDELLGTLPSVALDAELTERFRQGQRLAMDAQPRG
ncbi:MAG: tRNA pseudouridine(55) synthase TruB, partial [Burkholderiaceae bacterium]